MKDVKRALVGLRPSRFRRHEFEPFRAAPSYEPRTFSTSSPDEKAASMLLDFGNR